MRCRRAIGIGVVVVGEHAFHRQALADQLAQVHAAALRRDRQVLADLHLRGFAAQLARGPRADLVLELGGGGEDGRAAHHHGARMEGAEAVAQVSGGAVEDADAFHGHAQRIGGDLHADGLQALAEVGRTDVGADRAVRLDRQARMLARSGRAALDEAAHAQTMVDPVDQLALQRGLLLPSDFREAAVQGDLVVAAVVLETEGTRVRELLLLDEVLGADLGLVHAEFLRQDVDHALDQVHGLRHTETAAVGHAARRLVGVDALDRRERRRDVV